MLAFYLSLIEDKNDKIVFEEIYYSFRKQMFAVALSVLKNEYDAEDIVHDVFCTIAEKHIHTIRKIENKQDLRNYLLKATKNSALNKKRDEKKHLDINEKEIAFKKRLELNDNDFLDMICDNISYQELVKKIKNLDKKYADVLYLHFVLQFSSSEIAETLGKNTQTVKKQLVRGKHILINSLQKEEVATK